MNTVEEVLILLDSLRKKKVDYGMLSADNICFYNGSIKLCYGVDVSKK